MGLKSTIGWVLLAAVACGAPDRKNPNDPRGTDESTGEAIQLVARLPEGGTGGVSDVLAQIRYAVSGPGLPAAVEGRMDLIGRSARARVAGVPPGEDRVFRVTAMDPAEVITFAVVDTVDIAADAPQTVEVQLRRLGGRARGVAGGSSSAASGTSRFRVFSGGHSLMRFHCDSVF